MICARSKIRRLDAADQRRLRLVAGEVEAPAQASSTNCSIEDSDGSGRCSALSSCASAASSSPRSISDHESCARERREEEDPALGGGGGLPWLAAAITLAAAGTQAEEVVLEQAFQQRLDGDDDPGRGAAHGLARAQYVVGVEVVVPPARPSPSRRSS